MKWTQLILPLPTIQSKHAAQRVNMMVEIGGHPQPAAYQYSISVQFHICLHFINCRHYNYPPTNAAEN